MALSQLDCGEALQQFARVCAHKSPAEFADWCGCTVDEAIEIFAVAVAESWDWQRRAG